MSKIDITYTKQDIENTAARMRNDDNTSVTPEDLASEDSWLAGLEDEVSNVIGRILQRDPLEALDIMLHHHNAMSFSMAAGFILGIHCERYKNAEVHTSDE